ncbi:MAG: hypothetical protein ACR2JH_02120, partial [Solirubrobacteraceae bacterium]
MRRQSVLRSVLVLVAALLCLVPPEVAAAAGSTGSAGSPGAAGATGSPFSPGVPPPTGQIPPTSTAPVIAPPVTTPSTGSGLSGSSAIAIGVGAIIVLTGISLFIWRDARRRAPVRHRAAGEAAHAGS